MLRWIVLVFVVVPLGELYLLVWLSGVIGFWETLAITLVTGVLGGSLARREGLRVWRGFNQALGSGRRPEDGLVDGMLVLVGGAFLVTPGVVTDVVGLCLLFPLTRRPLGRLLRAVVQRELGRRLVNADGVDLGGVDLGGADVDGPTAFAASRRPPRHDPGPRGGGDVIDTTGVETGDPSS